MPVSNIKDREWKNKLSALIEERNNTVDAEIKRLKQEGKYNSGLNAHNSTVKKINEELEMDGEPYGLLQL